MPQMAPLSWLVLFMTFSLAFMIFNAVNYFCYPVELPPSSSKDSLETKSSINWKW